LHRIYLYALSLSLALLLGALASGVIDTNHSTGTVRDASSAFAGPGATPTYISELAPPVSRPPREAALPATGLADSSGIPWAPIAGAALAVLGILLTHAGLSSTRQHLQDERTTS
jgi:hypothetical protein